MHADIEQVYTAVARATVYINDQMMCVPACSGKRARISLIAAIPKGAASAPQGAASAPPSGLL